MPSLRHRPRDLIQNRYAVRRLLGSGAFGTVYGCMDEELQTPVAVKELHVLDERGGERAAALNQFRAEAIHLSKLNHPHIVRGHYQRDGGSWRVCPVCGLDFPQLRECPDHGAALISVDARHYLVMEYVGGPDLLARCESEGGKLSLAESLGWMEQIASALAHVHTRGFVHRDIKPENIRLRADSENEAGEAVLLDFGIASQNGTASGDRYGTRARRATMGGGTLGYAPPTPQEADNPDARSDIYAFGMTWYHLLCGLDPTEPATEKQMQAHTPRDFRPELALWLDALLSDCIALDPNRRPQNGEELLGRLQRGEGAVPAPTPFPANTAFPSQAPQTPTSVPATLPRAPQNAPLVFRSGHYARDLNDLVWLCDEFPDEAAKRLFDGEFESWLRGQGNETLARAAASARQSGSKRAGLETWVQATGLVARPEVQVSPATLDFGSFGKEAQKTRSLKLRRTGRGWVFGSATTSAGALSTPGSFEGESVEIPFSFDAFRLPPGRYDGQIQLNGSMGQIAVPWTASVRGPSALVPFLVVLGNGAFGMIAGGALRSIPFIVAHQQHLNWLDRNSLHQWRLIAPAFGASVAFFWLVWTILFALFRRSCGVLMSLVFFGTLFSIYCAFMGPTQLTGGDALLKPVLQPIVHDFAAGGWMYAGATIGALSGALWRWRDLASMRFWAVFAGFFATLLMVYFALRGAMMS
jgi:serine/threonine protein kinase